MYRIVQKTILVLYLVGNLSPLDSYAEEVTIDWRTGIYSGELINGIPNGKGTWTVPNVGTYVGGFKDGRLNGVGMQEYVDGTRYAGEYKNNTRSGQGWFMFGSGRFKGFSFIGEFKDDKFWNGKEFDEDFNLSATYLEGARNLE